MISDTHIRAILLTHGFELKEQPGQGKDLHPYVFRAVRAVLDFAMEASMQRIAERLPDDCQPPRPGVAGLLYAVSELLQKRNDAESGMDLLQIQLDELRSNTKEFVMYATSVDHGFVSDSIQQKAVELGLLIGHPITGYCSTADICECANQGVDVPGLCYRLNPLVFGGAV